jgi:hypothetical protein
MMGTFGKNPAERFCWPNHPFGCKIQTPALPDFNAGICYFLKTPCFADPR